MLSITLSTHDANCGLEGLRDVKLEVPLKCKSSRGNCAENWTDIYILKVSRLKGRVALVTRVPDIINLDR